MTQKPKFSASFIARSLNLTLPSGLDIDFVFSDITTDSRKIKQDSLFVALPGETFDGHDFIERALSQGARGVITQKNHAIVKKAPQNIFIYAVNDTLTAYRILSGAWRNQFTIPVIAVAGSAGKTTTKELLTALLRGKFTQVLKTEGSQNGFVGIPMTLLALRPEHQAAVIEVGIDEIGAMKKHMALVKPEVTIVTAIGPEHLEKLKDVTTVAHEEGLALTLTTQTGGTAVVNLDDSYMNSYSKTLPPRRTLCYTVGSQAVASNHTLCGTLSPSGDVITLNGLSLQNFTLKPPLLGAHNAANLTGAVVIARHFKLTEKELSQGLATFQGARGRSEIHTRGSGVTVLCDYYNAQPASMVAAFELLTELARKQPGSQRWVCLGDMRELGTNEVQYHKDLAIPLRKLGIENLVLMGPLMKHLAEELPKAVHVATHQEAADILKAGLKPPAVLLIKGSRSLRMEEVWKLLQPSQQSPQ